MIGIFDSGIGGLSVFLELKKLLPKHSFYYLADQKNAPYGTKTQSLIKRFTLNGLKFLQTKKVELIVIACNTATVSGIEYYRKRIKIPLVGVVPAIKPAAQNPKSKIICVLTTNLTKNSGYQKSLIKKFSNNKKIIALANSELVDFVEKGDFTSKNFTAEINKLSSQLKKYQADSLVFGCTHFVFLKKYFPQKLSFYDSGIAVSRQTKRLLKNDNNLLKKDIFATTGNPKKFLQVADFLLGAKLEARKVKL